MSEKSKSKKYTKLHNKKFSDKYYEFIRSGNRAWVLFNKNISPQYMKQFNELFARHKNCPDWIKQDWFLRTGANDTVQS